MTPYLLNVHPEYWIIAHTVVVLVGFGMLHEWLEPESDGESAWCFVMAVFWEFSLLIFAGILLARNIKRLTTRPDLKIHEKDAA